MLEQLEKIKEFAIYKVENKDIEMLYFDFNFSVNHLTDNTVITELDRPMSRNFEEVDELQNSEPISRVLKKILPLYDKTLDYKEVVAKYLKENVKKSNIFIDDTDAQLFDIYIQKIKDSSELPDIELTDFITTKIISKFTTASYYIATDGRIGFAHNIIMNKNTFDKYLNNNYSSNINDMIVILNEFVEDNIIYLTRRCTKDEPGFKILYNIDKDNNEYCDIISLGFFPHKQALKIEIID